jgi:hypothetical protein
METQSHLCVFERRMEDKKNILSSAWRKIARYSKAIGQKTVYSVLLMFYAFRRRETPAFARTIILGDLGVLSFGLVTIASYINDEVRIKARKALAKVFPKPDLESLQRVDKTL